MRRAGHGEEIEISKTHKTIRLRGESLESRCLLTGTVLQSTSTEIVLNLGPVISQNSEAVAALRRAADTWEATLNDPVQIHLDIEFDNGRTDGDSALAGAVSAFTTFFYPDIRQRLIDDAAADEAIVDRLPTATDLAFTLPDGISIRDPLGDAPVIRLTTANAKALGFHDVDVPASEFQNGVADASIFFSETTTFDFDSSDGINRNAFDFEGVAVHEIGHALGLVSTLDVVDTLLANGQGANVDPAIPDLFRLRPGQGAQFETAPRLLTTGGADTLQVFHDGVYDPSGFAGVIPQLETGDIPLSSGVEFGDGQQASHFKDDARSGVFIGILDPTIAPGVVAEISETDIRVIGLIGWDVGSDEFDSIAVGAADPEFDNTILTGSVSEPDAQVFVRIPSIHTSNVVSANARLNGDVTTISISNDASSESQVAGVQFILPGVGGGSGAAAATPFWSPASMDFSASAGDVNRVGLLSPESDNVAGDDVAAFSKSLELLFQDFEPGESFEFSVGVGNGVIPSTLDGTRMIVDFENGVREIIELSQFGNTLSATLVSDHYVQATNRGDGTWELRDTELAQLSGSHTLIGTTVDRTGALATFAGTIQRAPSLFQNPTNRLDVNNDSLISPIDALIVINRLNSSLPSDLTDAADNESPPPFFDVNGDGFVSPLDALEIINSLTLSELNANASAALSQNLELQAEAPSPMTFDIAMAAFPFDSDLDRNDESS